MRLLSVKKSSARGKKYTAVFEGPNGRRKSVSFGAAGMDDYTRTHDQNQRSRYRQRHSKDLGTRDPTSAGFLSYYLLWGPSTSLQQNVAAYKRRFHL
jgi:hypothetical protein